MDEKYLFILCREEMRTRVKALTGFKKEREEIKTLAKIIFNKEIESIEEYMKFLNMNGNVLLFGKPGTGKTSICYDCMLDNANAAYYELNMSALISEKLGKTAQKIEEIFGELLNETKKYPIYLLVEEIAAFLPNGKESADLEDMKRALAVFMHYLDKINPNLMVICTTNHLESLNPDIIKRFTCKIEITNNSIEDMEQFLTNKENPFHIFFNDKSINHKIAEKIIEREMTFLDVKNMMKRLLLKDNGKKIESVNGDNLYKMLMEEDRG